MSLMMRLQLLAILVAIASMVLVHVWLSHLIPAPRLLLYDLVFGGFILWWAGSILWLRGRRRVAEDNVEGWYRHTLAVFWIGNLATVITFWIAMPYGSEALRLLVTMMCMSPVVVEIIGTIRAPDHGPRGRWSTWAPLGIPLGLILFFAGSGDEFAIPVILFLLSFTAGLLIMRELVQGSVSQAWHARRTAEAASAARTRFLASASHDLGQPLQAARLFFDQAIANPAGAGRDAAVRGVQRAFDATEALLGQMLEHLRLEAGQVATRLEPLALGPLIAGIAERHEPEARLAGIAIIALPTRLMATGDRGLLDRALGNLVANAIRHSNGSRVLVGARWQGGRVRIWVIDDGGGIPEIDLPRLFDDHFQGSNHGDQVRGGFGLGLASTRRLAALMAGTVGLDRRWTGGCAFWLELPAA